MGMTRRALLATGLASAGIGVIGDAAYGRSGKVSQLKPREAEPLQAIPADYVGFSIETMTLENPDIYTGHNHSLIALHRRLSPHGVLRIGGNSSEFCWWHDATHPVPPEIHAAGQGRAGNWMPQQFHAITPKAIDNLRAFLDATGWTCIYGLNFGTGSPDRDAHEAAYVASTLGPRLRYFQIGNEPDFYMSANNMLRPSGWGFDDYLREWQAIARAVIAGVPDARFGGPDVGSSADWVVRFGEAMKPLVGRRLVELTGHYYAEGPPDDPKTTIRRLLRRDPAITERMHAIMPAARREDLGFRMSEGNSCYRGGKAGMSDAFAATLWAADYMLYMASLGCGGINLHGGSGHAISSSLGGKLPGARDDRDRRAAALGAFYSPFAGTPAQGYTARPVFYGMLAAQQFAGTRLVANDFDPGDVNATAYTARTAEGWRMMIVNKDAVSDMDVSIALPDPVPRTAKVWRLDAPSLDATTGVRLAGDAIAPGSSAWSPRGVAAYPKGGTLDITVPAASAAVIFMEGARA